MRNGECDVFIQQNKEQASSMEVDEDKKEGEDDKSAQDNAITVRMHSCIL